MFSLVNSLNRLLAHNVLWRWSDAYQEAFMKLKKALENSLLLTRYDSKKPVRLVVEASHCGIGAVLSHVSEDGEDETIAYACLAHSLRVNNIIR